MDTPSFPAEWSARWNSLWEALVGFNWDANWVAIGISALAFITSIFALRASYGQYFVAKHKWLSDDLHNISEQARLVAIRPSLIDPKGGEWEVNIDIYNSSSSPIFPLGFVMVFHRGAFFIKHSGMSTNCEISKIWPEMKCISTYTQSLYTLSSLLSFNDKIKFKQYDWKPIDPGKSECKIRYTENTYPFPFKRGSGWVFDDMNGNTWTRRFDGKLFEGIDLGGGDSLR